MSFTLYHTIIGYICGECPAADLIKPCVCGGHEFIDLKSLFHNLSLTLPKDKWHLNSFLSNNTAIKELPENLFGDIIFDSVIIWNAPNLSLIHTNAFNGTDLNGLNNQFNVNNTTLKNSPPTHDIFHAISSLVNIKYIYLIKNMIEEIPDYAFKPINGPQNSLSSLYISDNNIKRIGKFAFKDLNHLNILSIESNKVINITKNILSFEKSSDF